MPAESAVPDALGRPFPALGAAPPLGRGRRLPFLSLTIIGGFVLVALLADVLSPADPEAQSLRARFTPPARDARGTWAHVLGTARPGRDPRARATRGA